jgi:hypothetical protein
VEELKELLVSKPRIEPGTFRHFNDSVTTFGLKEVMYDKLFPEVPFVLTIPRLACSLSVVKPAIDFCRMWTKSIIISLLLYR